MSIKLETANPVRTFKAGALSTADAVLAPLPVEVSGGAVTHISAGGVAGTAGR